jgi:predicted unusual protein kinase regulating ubiquinone biosynthesis (AarF/ABC1/UbiB family)
MHISKEEQTRRFKKLSKDPLESWHVTPEDYEHHRKYGKYVLAIEEMFERTNSEWGPWTIMESTDRRWTRVKIFETIIHRLEEALKARGKPLPPLPTAFQMAEEDHNETTPSPAALDSAEVQSC